MCMIFMNGYRGYSEMMNSQHRLQMEYAWYLRMCKQLCQLQLAEAMFHSWWLWMHYYMNFHH
jgi:hypothetical protein